MLLANYITPEHTLEVFHQKFFKIFLAGSIEMGAASNWQHKVMNDLSETAHETLFLNPRRADWDSSWEQVASNPQFRHQVTWELDMLDHADMIVVYFDPNTKAPISLLELGLHAKGTKQILVCCPDGFWRKGNIQIVCERYNIPMFDTYEDWVEQISTSIKIARCGELLV